MQMIGIADNLIQQNSDILTGTMPNSALCLYTSPPTSIQELIEQRSRIRFG